MRKIPILLALILTAIAMMGAGTTLPSTAPATAPGKELVLDLGNKQTLKLVQIPAGKFIMGSKPDEPFRDEHEHPQHEVTISKPFYMGVTHVTVDQFESFVKDSGYQTQAEVDKDTLKITIGDGVVRYFKGRGLSWKAPGFDQKGDYPVVQVTWNDAQAFCKWLSKKSGKTVKLPTEAQWEYACRAGTQTVYFWGDKPEDGKGYANCGDQSLAKLLTKHIWTNYFPWDDGYVYTSPVATFKPNAFGLYDMIGNAWQWCEDHAGEATEDAVTDPTGPEEGEQRVNRGGSWFNRIGLCRIAYRSYFLQKGKNGTMGFRVIVTAE